MYRGTDEGFQSGYLSWSSIWWYELDYHRRGLGAGQESIPYRVSCIAAKLSPYWCEAIIMKTNLSLYGGSTGTPNRYVLGSQFLETDSIDTLVQR